MGIRHIRDHAQDADVQVALYIGGCTDFIIQHIQYQDNTAYHHKSRHGRQRQPRWVSILIYLAMGWLVVFRLRELVAALDPVALALLVVGGLCYTIGTIFYLLKKIRYMHSVWHLWVLAGSIFIFMAVILYVI